MKITVNLWIRAGESEAFRSYEETAFDIMKDHGIEVLSIKRPSNPSSGEPDEIHNLRCKSVEVLYAYRADPRLKALAGLRERAITQTEVLIRAELDSEVVFSP